MFTWLEKHSRWIKLLKLRHRFAVLGLESALLQFAAPQGGGHFQNG